MTIFGKRLSEYVAFSKPFLSLILVVGIVRFALSLGGVPNSAVKWISITAVRWIGVLYYSVRVHTSGFGSYKQLLPICFLQRLTAQVVIVPAIMLAIFTGTDNIYSAPEFSFGADGKTWFHVCGPSVDRNDCRVPDGSWLVGCLVMFATKKLAPKERTPRHGECVSFTSGTGGRRVGRPWFVRYFSEGFHAVFQRPFDENCPLDGDFIGSVVAT